MDKLKNAVASYDYAFAVYTDSAGFIIDKSAPLCEEKLLELRCFSVEGEYRAVRVGGLSEVKFSEREITHDNEASYASGYYDEAQYLDIDESRTKNAADGFVYATGGGSYLLPESAKGNKMILVRHYYQFDCDGVARPFDWRLVDFTNEETVGKGDK